MKSDDENAVRGVVKYFAQNLGSSRQLQDNQGVMPPLPSSVDDDSSANENPSVDDAVFQRHIAKDDDLGGGILLSEISCTGLPAFPFRLHDMLNDAEPKGFDHVVGWQKDGKSFKVHDKDQFSSNILPLYFQGQTRYKSFQRQLNIYGFTRILTGTNKEKGGYTHDLLVRGKPMMCRLMIRTKIKNKGSRPSSSDSLVRMKQLPSEPVDMQNSSFPIQRSSAPDFASLVGATSASNFDCTFSPRQMSGTTTTSYQNERFTPQQTNHTFPQRSYFQGGPGLLQTFAGKGDGNNDFGASWIRDYKASILQARKQQDSSSTSRFQMKSLPADALHVFSRNPTRPNQRDLLLPVAGIVEGNQNAKWRQPLLFGSLEELDGGQVKTPPADPLAMDDDSDMESDFDETDFDIPNADASLLYPFNSFNISSDSAIFSGDTSSIDDQTSRCPVAAELVEVFHPC